MKPSLAFLAVLTFTLTASAEQAPLSPQELAAFVSAAAPDQKVSITQTGSSYTFYGPKGTGRIVPAGGGWTIYYDGKTRNVTGNTSGWNIYGGSKPVTITGASPKGSRSIYGLNGSGGSVVSYGGRQSNVYYGGKGHDVRSDGSGLTVYAPPSARTTSRAQDPLSQQELAAIVSAAAPHQSVNITQTGGSYTFYGPKGTGKIISAGSGWKVYYDGQTRDVIGNGNGWNVYGGGKTVNITSTRLTSTSPVGSLRIHGLGDSGSVTSTGGGSTVYYGGQTHSAVRSGNGIAIYAPPSARAIPTSTPARK